MKIIYGVFLFFFPLFTLIGEETPPDQSQNTLDTLFQDTHDIESPSEMVPLTDHTQNFEKPLGLKISGTFTLQLGGIAATSLDSPSSWSFQPGGKGKLSFLFHGVASQELEVFSTLSTSLKPELVYNEPIKWDTPVISDTYVLYYGFRPLFITLGNFSSSWGKGKLFTLDGLSDLSSHFTIKVSIPTFLSGLSFFVMAQNTTYTSLKGAFQLDYLLGPFAISHGIKYSYEQGFLTQNSFQGTLWGFDLYGDILYLYSSEGYSIQSLVGFFKQIQNLVMIGEYSYDKGINKSKIGIFIKKIGPSLDGLVLWDHRYLYQEGQLQVGINWYGLSHISLAALSIFGYGKNNINLEMKDTEKEELSFTVPGQVAFFIGLNISGDF